MVDVIHLPLEDGDRLAEPPLLDLLREDTASASWVVTFVPSDDVSNEQVETVTVQKGSSSEARYIQYLLAEVQRLSGGAIRVISHLGGGDYTLQFADNSSKKLSECGSNAIVEIFDRLRQIAQNAEFVFRVQHRSATARHRSAV